MMKKISKAEDVKGEEIEFFKKEYFKQTSQAKCFFI